MRINANAKTIPDVAAMAPAEAPPSLGDLVMLLDAVRHVLRRKGFSEHAIEHAITVVYRRAMPYIDGSKICQARNPKAWVFKVAIRAAARAAKRELHYKTVEPTFLAATANDCGEHEELFDIQSVLMQLTAQQRRAVELCILSDMSHREAAREMGIAVGTLSGYLKAAMNRLKEILGPHCSRVGSRIIFTPGARAS